MKRTVQLILLAMLPCLVFAGSIEQQLFVSSNAGVNGGAFWVAIQVKHTGLALSTIKSATVDVSYDNTKLTYVSSTFNAALSVAAGYTCSVTNNTTFVRFLVAGSGVDTSPAGDPATCGMDLTTSYVTLVTVKFTIVNSATTTSLATLTGSNAFSIFSTAQNVDGSGVSLSPAPTLTAPINLINIPLPVELTSFTAAAKGRHIELNWATATESNNSGFQIERLGGKSTEWTKVSFVDGNGTTNAPHTYSYADAVSAAGKYSYRLKQIDRNGSFIYSNTVEVVSQLVAEDYALSANYPNPFNPSTSFHFAMKKAGQVSVNVYNSLGQEVRSLFNGPAVQEQMYDITFNADGLTSGTYFYVLRAQDRVEVKKMVLMK